MRQNWLSNRIFRFFDVIVDHCCFAWNTLIDQPWKIMSFARRDCAVVGDSSRGLVLELSARNEGPAAWAGLAANSTSCAASISPTCLGVLASFAGDQVLLNNLGYSMM